MSPKLSVSKVYTDHAVQTSFLSPSSPRSVTPNEFNIDFQPQSSSFLEEYSPQNNSQPFVENENTCSASYTTYSSSPAHSITTTRRVIKPQQLPAQYPSQLLQTDTQRTASLPETVSLYSAKSQFDSGSYRVVSMPERLKSLRHAKEFKIYSSDYNDISASTVDSIISGNGNRSRTAINSTRVPRTPSPPSSPESIVIIENKYQLSETFLRNNQVIRELSGAGREGWVTWATSPPRPIPALHGPLSLPYARCPSGAEGTVIEEQDNLPRMIWGLSGDHPGITDDALYTASQREPHFFPNVPPRLHNRESKPTLPSRATRPPAQPEHQLQNNLSAPVEQEFEYPAQFNETIDLSRLLPQSRLQDSSNLPHPTSHTKTSRGQVHGFHDETQIYNTRESQHPRWQSSHPRERLQHPALLSSGASRSEGVIMQSKPLVSTRPAAGSSRPVIILDSQSNSMSLPPPRRLSAIEIAQKFRQQQSLLPTPPNSTSPQWSSDFSPYQDPALASEAVFLSSLSPDIQQDIAHHLRQSVYERVANSINDAYLAPAAHIKPNLNSQVNGTYSQGAHRHTRAHQSYFQSGSVAVSQFYDAGHNPRPPPNIPLPPIPSSRNSDLNHKKPQSGAEISAAPSPTSPSHSRLPQQPRSIPLTRLVQRRLSAVLEACEEPSNATLDGLRSSSPPAFQQNFHLSHASTPGLQHVTPRVEDSRRRSVQYQQTLDRPTTKVSGKKTGTVHGDDAGELSAFSQIKAQLYGSNHTGVRDHRTRSQLEESKVVSKDRKTLAADRENGIKARNLVPKGQTSSARRKIRGKKKSGPIGENMAIVT